MPRMAMVHQQNRKLFKMKKMKVGFQIDAMLIGWERPLMSHNLW